MRETAVRTSAVLAILLCLAGTSDSAATAADIAAVVRQDVPVDDVSFSEVRQLFDGSRQFWASKLRVTLLVQPPGSRERVLMLRRIYQMSEAQFRQFWISKVFRAEAASSPKLVFSNEMAMEMVAAIPGAVALVDSSLVPKTFKVLRIDGHAPGDRDYPLH